ncbi:aggregative adherence fimbria I chaperone AggD [Escherichia coli]
MKIRRIVSTIAIALSVFTFAHAQSFENVENNAKVFSLHLGATRMIYKPNSSGETLAVINEHNYPILVQANVLSEDQKSIAPFIITPPLFRLDALQSSRLRIVKTEGAFPIDRESLQWICVKAIPPKYEDKWAKEEVSGKKSDKATMNIQVSVSSCIKLFVRPADVKGQPDDVAGKIKWQKVGNKLKGVNPTPFYMDIAELRVGEKEITETHYIAPFSSYEYPMPVNGGGDVRWKVVTDYGGISKTFETGLNI